MWGIFQRALTISLYPKPIQYTYVALSLTQIKWKSGRRLCFPLRVGSVCCSILVHLKLAKIRTMDQIAQTLGQF